MPGRVSTKIKILAVKTPPYLSHELLLPLPASGVKLNRTMDIKFEWISKTTISSLGRRLQNSHGKLAPSLLGQMDTASQVQLRLGNLDLRWTCCKSNLASGLNDEIMVKLVKPHHVACRHVACHCLVHSYNQESTTCSGDT